jgi:hypothetical protein
MRMIMLLTILTVAGCNAHQPEVTSTLPESYYETPRENTETKPVAEPLSAIPGSPHLFKAGTYFNPCYPDHRAMPGAGFSWDIKDPSGTVIATSASPNGWDFGAKLGYGAGVVLTVPASAPTGANYEARSYVALTGPMTASTKVAPRTDSQAAYFAVVP